MSDNFTKLRIPGTNLYFTPSSPWGGLSPEEETIADAFSNRKLPEGNGDRFFDNLTSQKAIASAERLKKALSGKTELGNNL